MVIVLDSISQQQFLRTSGHTAALLSEWQADESDESHEVFQLLQHNVLGRGTYNNMGKFYTGLPTFDEGEKQREFLHTIARENGYATSYGEQLHN